MSDPESSIEVERWQTRHRNSDSDPNLKCGRDFIGPEESGTLGFGKKKRLTALGVDGRDSGVYNWTSPPDCQGRRYMSKSQL